jgi:MFS superfamily sulfate permease-like transporter
LFCYIKQWFIIDFLVYDVYHSFLHQNLNTFAHYKIAMKRKLKYYQLIWLKHDLPAGLSVFLVALPLCLGIALASGAPLYSGLLSGIIGGLLVSVISKSQLGVSGPAAGLTTLVSASIISLGGFQTFLLAVIVAGFFKLF